jgi:thioredoxin 1
MMIKRLLLSLTLGVCMCMSAQAQHEGIKFFKGSFKEALQKAQKENKMIFMDAYTEWCGPCKLLKSSVFTDKSLGEYMNKNFVCLAVDMENGEGLSLADRYPLNAYPTMFFMDNKGQVKDVKVGYPRGGANELLGFAKKIGK